MDMATPSFSNSYHGSVTAQCHRGIGRVFGQKNAFCSYPKVGNCEHLKMAGNLKTYLVKEP
jgi:hypothetical protein